MQVGAWLLLPTQSSGRVERLGEEDTVVLYLHGNSSNRAQPHRTHLYHALLQLGYHVLAVDYRGFGDSSPVSVISQLCLVKGSACLSEPYLNFYIVEYYSLLSFTNNMPRGECYRWLSVFKGGWWVQ